MKRTPAPHRAGSLSPQLLPFLILVALVAVGLGIGWFVLSGSGANRLAKPDDGPPKEAAPSDDPVKPSIETAEPPAPEVSDEKWNVARDQLKGNTFPVRKLGSDKYDQVPMFPLRGKVVDDRDEQPVYFFSVYMLPVDDADPLSARNSVAPSHFRNGEFYLDHQPGGEYNLVVESREHEPVTRRIAVPYDGELVVRLHQGSCVRGVVRDVALTPLKDLEVTLGVVAIDGDAPPPVQRMTKSDEMGRFSFWKLPPGRYTLSVGLLGDVLADEREFRLDPGAEVLRDFTLERLGGLKLTVKNVADQPVARARVVLLKSMDDGRDRPVRTSYSDLKGVARLDFVRAGSYKLRVQVQGFRLYEEPVAVAAGDSMREVPVLLEIAPRQGQ